MMIGRVVYKLAAKVCIFYLPNTTGQNSINWYKFKVNREYNLGAANIDILAVNDEDKIIFAVENKIFSDESKEQTPKYYNKIKSLFPNYSYHLFYLSVDGERPSSDAFKFVRYSSLSEVFRGYLSFPSLEDNSITQFIKEYLEVLDEMTFHGTAGTLCKEIHKQNISHFDDSNSLKQLRKLDLTLDYLCKYIKKENTILTNNAQEVIYSFIKSDDHLGLTTQYTNNDYQINFKDKVLMHTADYKKIVVTIRIQRESDKLLLHPVFTRETETKEFKKTIENWVEKFNYTEVVSDWENKIVIKESLEQLWSEFDKDARTELIGELKEII